MKKLKIPAAIMIATFLLSMFPPYTAKADENEIHITILGTSDVHSNIWGYTYEDNKETENDGMARLSTYIDQVRAENPNTILIDAGDSIQGTILTDDIYNRREDGEHPVMAARNYMKYDAWTLGNHEFNFGIDVLKRIMSQSEAPVLAANAFYKDNGELLTGKAYTIVECEGVKVAIIGLTNPDIPVWDGDKVEMLRFEAVSDAVGRCIDEIGDQADVIVVSAHVGVYPEFDEENGSDSAQKIIDEHPEVDVVQVAHTHLTVEETIGNAIVGGVRKGGREIARFDLTLGKDKQVIDKKVSIVSMEGTDPSAKLRELPIVKEAHQATIDFINGGGSKDGDADGGNVFGEAMADFQPVDEITGIPEGKLQDTAVMDLINKVMLLNSGADVSAVSLFQNSSDIKKGPINYGTIFNIYKFDNTLCRVPVTGKELKNYMEWSAECFNQSVPGDITISFDEEYLGARGDRDRYDVFAGVDYEIDLTEPKGQRIKNVIFHGEPLKDDQHLTLCVNNYRYSSALKTEKLVEAKKEWESPNSIRDMIVEYIVKQKELYPEVDYNWKITGVDMESPYRGEIIRMVNDGEIAIPYTKSLNINDFPDVVKEIDMKNASLETTETAETTEMDQSGEIAVIVLVVVILGIIAVFIKKRNNREK